MCHGIHHGSSVTIRVIRGFVGSQFPVDLYVDLYCPMISPIIRIFIDIVGLMTCWDHGRYAQPEGEIRISMIQMDILQNVA